MAENEETKNEATPKFGDQIAKLLIATAVGFIATKAAEKAYDSVRNARQNQTVELSQ